MPRANYPRTCKLVSASLSDTPYPTRSVYMIKTYSEDTAQPVKSAKAVSKHSNHQKIRLGNPNDPVFVASRLLGITPVEYLSMIDNKAKQSSIQLDSPSSIEVIPITPLPTAIPVEDLAALTIATPSSSVVQATSAPLPISGVSTEALHFRQLTDLELQISAALDFYPNTFTIQEQLMPPFDVIHSSYTTSHSMHRLPSFVAFSPHLEPMAPHTSDQLDLDSYFQDLPSPAPALAPLPFDQQVLAIDPALIWGVGISGLPLPSFA